MQKRIIALTLAVLLFMSTLNGLSADNSMFSDLTGHWSEETIIALAKDGIINGFPDGTVRPDATMSRGEYACLVANLMEIQDHVADGDPTFNDTQDSWAHHYIEALVAAGIIKKETDTYNPNEPVTRVEMARMLVYALGFDDATAEATLTSFADDEDIRAEDKVFVTAAKELGLINGRPGNLFSPNDHSTRAEAFTIISNFRAVMENVGSESGDAVSSAADKDTSIPILKPESNSSSTAVPIINTDKSGSSKTSSQNTSNSNSSSSGSGITKPAPLPSAPVFPSKPENTPTPAPAPKPEIDIGLPGTIDTDDDGNLVLDLTGTENMQIEWSLTYNGDPVELSEHIEGELTLSGGAIKFKYKGVYVLTARITDSKGNKYTVTSTIIYYPAPVIEFSLPAYLYDDGIYEVETTLTNMDELDIVWTLKRSNKDVTLSDYVEGTLDNDGGSVRFKSSGSYKLTASVTDVVKRTYSFSAEITIYETMDFSLDFSNTIYSGGGNSVVITLPNPDNLEVLWELTHDGADVLLSDYIDGSLTNTGGSVKFKQKGDYTLKVTITDKTGREFTASAAITVYPVPTVDFSIPKYLYTDDVHTLITELDEMDGLSVVWSLELNNANVILSDYIEGALDDNGGTIRFKTDGDYTLTASVTDGADRTFTTTASVTVYEVLDFEFELPDSGYAGEDGTFVIELDNPDDLPVEWELERDGEKVDLDDYIEGELGNSGGAIKFKQKGTYVLKGKVKDKNGREYEVSSTVTVYPTPGFTFSLPELLYTDDVYSLETELFEMDDLGIIWTLKRSNTTVVLSDYISGTLTSNGGTIQFNQPGEYQLTASVTDEYDRTFEETATVTVYPTIELEFILPDAAHTDTVIDLESENGSSINPVWSMTCNDIDVDPTDYIEGSLSDEDGTIRFTQPGTYTITMSVTDENERIFTAVKTVIIYPVLELSLEIPGVLHTDDVCEVVLTGAEDINVAWSLTRDGSSVTPVSFIDGTLTNNGGSVYFTKKGNYELTAAVTDNASRVFAASKKATVYPVPDMSFNINSIGYPNTAIPLTTSFVDVEQPVTWSLKFGGVPVSFSSYTTGTLTNSGGSLTFTQTGNFEITATMTDSEGRSYSESRSISIENVLNCDFKIQNTNQHISKSFAVSMEATANLSGRTITWTLTKGGTGTGYTGTLGNSGGNINATAAGTFTLTATVIDGLGRAITCSKNFTVYNNAPSTPSIYRSPSGSTVSPKQATTITCSGSTDPDGDSITYVWENRYADSYYYSEGSYTIRVKARDAYGAESGWATTSFTSELRNESSSLPVGYNGAETTINAPSGKYMKSVTVSSNSFLGMSDSYYSVSTQWFNSNTQQWESYAFDLKSQTSYVISTADKKYTSVKFKFLTGNYNPYGTVYYDIEYFYP